jgi:two-component system phosphate regulon sensor histidine kinase PhoR
MSPKTIRFILILMLITISGLFITQVYWFKKSFTLHQRQFDEKINIALRSVAHQLLISNKDTSSRIPPISKISSNEFYVNTNCYFKLKNLDNIIKQEFLKRNININYDYTILKSDDFDILLGNTVSDSHTPNQSITIEIACKTRIDDNENLDFKIRINNKTVHLINSMGIWMYSSLSLLFILAVFTFIMISIIKGKRLSELKKDFVNNMTHELKTPITNISVASNAIRNESIQMDKDKLKKYADIIYNENVRLHNLVDKVLQVSAIEKDDESLTYEEIDVHKIIKNVLVNFEPLLQQKGGHINSNLKANNFILYADKTHLSNVIYNLVENAIKYSNTNPEITINTNNASNGINITISDKGIGIKKEDQQHVFEKFFRAETGNLHNTKGHGIGLSYVKLIIEKHNGKLTFKSKLKKGSTFNIYLPLK